jgi:hypothetical protein
MYVGVDKIQIAQVAGLGSRLIALEQWQASDQASDAQLPKQAFEQACNWLKSRKSAPVKALVSDQFARFFISAQLQGMQSFDDISAYARIGFDDIYGAGSHIGWRMATSQQAPGENALSSAVPEVMIRSLEASLNAINFKLASVRPNLAVAAKAFARAMGKTGWLAHFESQRLSLLGWDAGGWQYVGSCRLGKESASATLKAQMMLAGAGWGAGNDQRPLYICSPATDTSAWPKLGDRDQQIWRLPESAQSQANQLKRGSQLTGSAMLSQSQTSLEFGHLLLGLKA